jgi:Domain of unknown function (DUF4258)
MPPWPEWWDWELELTPHLLKRMAERRFSEVDVRAMLHEAHGLRPAESPGRWIAESKHENDAWEVVIEPLFDERILLVITAYRCW